MNEHHHCRPTPRFHFVVRNLDLNVNYQNIELTLLTHASKGGNFAIYQMKEA